MRHRDAQRRQHARQQQDDELAESQLPVAARVVQPEAESSAELLRLQRLIGNAGTGRMLAGAETSQAMLRLPVLQRDGPDGGTAPATAAQQPQTGPPPANATPIATTTLVIPLNVTPPDRVPESEPPAHAAPTPAAPEGPRLGVDVTAGVQGGLAAFDLANTRNHANPFHTAMLRYGLQPFAGDLSAAIGVLAVCRDCNVAPHLWSNWDLLHEVQGQLTVTEQSGMPSAFAVLGLAAGVDVFHLQIDTILGQLDWHALVAQVYENLAIPESSGGGPLIDQLGANIGTALELHPGRQKRFSITAALAVQGQDNMPVGGGPATGSGVLNFSVIFTGNAWHP